MAWLRMYSVNVSLIVIAIAGVAFGIVGFLLGGSDTGLVVAANDDVLPASSLPEPNRPQPAAPIADPENDLPLPRHFPEETSAILTDAVNRGNPPDTLKTRPTFTSNPDDKGDATIHGRVFDRDGNPVPMADVTAVRCDLVIPYPQGANAGREEYWQGILDYYAETARQNRCVKTNNTGEFVFTGLDPSLAYNITTTTRANATAYQYNIAAGDTVDLYLQLTSVIVRGRIVSESKRSLGVYSVACATEGAHKGRHSYAMNFSNADGSFELILREVGKWSFTATADMQYQREPVILDIPETGLDGMTLEVIDGAALFGKTLGPDGKPIGNILVQLTSANDEDDNRNSNSKDNVERGGLKKASSSKARRLTNTGGSRPCNQVTSDSLGRYRFASMRPGSYTLTVTVGNKTSQQNVSISSGEVEQDINVNTGALVTFDISAQDGRKLMDDSVYASKDSNNQVQMLRLSQQPGDCRYAGLDPGEYRFRIFVPDYAPQDVNANICDGENMVTVIMLPPCSIAGACSLRDGGSVANLGLYVMMMPINRNGGADTDSSNSNNNGTWVTITEDGSYAHSPLSAGEFNLKVISNSNTQKTLYETTITLTPGENLHDMVVSAGGILVVKLLDDQGQPVQGYAQLSSNSATSGADNQNQPLHAYSYNGQNAVFSFVEPGSYTLSAYRNDGSPSNAQPQTVFVAEGRNEITMYFQSSK